VGWPPRSDSLAHTRPRPGLSSLHKPRPLDHLNVGKVSDGGGDITSDYASHAKSLRISELRRVTFTGSTPRVKPDAALGGHGHAPRPAWPVVIGGLWAFPLSFGFYPLESYRGW
jgi:hypothetical protein